jgi:predicted metal-dependent hydrolase
MKEPTIYVNNKNHNINEALKILTDEWVDDGNYSAQTVIDLRDAVVFYMKECKKFEQQKIDNYWPGA